MFGNVTALEGLHVIREIQGNRARWRLAFGIRHGILTEGGAYERGTPESKFRTRGGHCDSKSSEGVLFYNDYYGPGV